MGSCSNKASNVISVLDNLNYLEFCDSPYMGTLLLMAHARD